MKSFFTILFVDKEPNTIFIDRLKEYQDTKNKPKTQREERKAEGETQGKTACNSED